MHEMLYLCSKTITGNTHPTTYTLRMKTAIIGGGAAGFFLAVNLKEMMTDMQVTVFERSTRVLAKVEVSGGGRCNCTNSFACVSDLSQVYPRGHRLLKRLMNVFDYQDAYRWFEEHGVPLVTQDDECVFPQAQDAHAIIDCFLSLAKRYGITICTGQRIQSPDILNDYDFVAVTTGGSPTGASLKWLSDMGHELVQPVPSLFTFAIDDSRLNELQGVVVNQATAHIPGTKFRAEGPLLITHWGVSGPAILKLSSYAARYLADNNYNSPLSIRWTPHNESDVQDLLCQWAVRNPQKMIATTNPFGLSSRLWEYLIGKALTNRASIRWNELNKKDMNRLSSLLTADNYHIAGRAAFKDEFVTCGGIALSSVNPSTLESRHVPHLYFAGEVLDIDGITGGFNFQAAWTTAYTVACSIASVASKL